MFPNVIGLKDNPEERLINWNTMRFLKEVDLKEDYRFFLRNYVEVPKGEPLI